MSEKILALDISGTATGWAFGFDGKLENFGKYIVKQSESKGQKLLEFSKFLEELFYNKSPDIILIERPFKGRNSNVLANLSKFIAIAEMAAYKVLSLEINDSWFLDPRQIKRLLKVRKGRDHDENKKNMVQKINNLYGLRLKYKINKNKKYCDDDISDAIAILTAWWKLNKNE